MHTDIMKTEGLRQMLDSYQYDAVFGGARRDEEKSRAKERIYSFRDKNHRWDPKAQRPELWDTYNGRHQKGSRFEYFRYLIGLSSIFGNISTLKGYLFLICILQKNAQWLSTVEPK